MKFLLFILLGFTLPGKSPEIYAHSINTKAAIIDSSVFNYYPLKIGNSWNYISTGYMYYRRSNIRITGDTVINGKKYFLLLYRDNNSNTNLTYRRIDSLNGNLTSFSPVNGCAWNSNEIILDSLGSKQNDSCKCNNHLCSQLFNEFIFGENRNKKEFKFKSGFESGYYTIYIENIGITYSYTYGGTGGTTTYIIGAYINGELYGDTNLVPVVQISSLIPENFILFQNYPNPFNPATNIKFQIPNTGFVKLVIYDALGKEVEIIVKHELQPGTYEADWDATDYPSGIYYYRLLTDNFSETKKMVLIK